MRASSSFSFRAAMKRNAAAMEDEESKNDEVTFKRSAIDSNLCRHEELQIAAQNALQNAFEELESMVEGLEHLEKATKQLQAFLPTCGAAQEGYTHGFREQTDKIVVMTVEARRTMCILMRLKYILAHGDDYRNGGDGWMLASTAVVSVSGATQGRSSDSPAASAG